VPYVFLRNGWYIENYTDNRATADGHAGKAYELGGDDAFTLAQLAAEVAAQSGTAVAYQDMPGEEYAKMLAGAGLPEYFAKVLADNDLGIARGDLYTDRRDLQQLIGRPTTSLADAVAVAVKTA
jgi:NAD(P)H dehydrogenase (quinone)